jgi:hypothetical protein
MATPLKDATGSQSTASRVPNQADTGAVLWRGGRAVDRAPRSVTGSPALPSIATLRRFEVQEAALAGSGIGDVVDRDH